MKTFSESLKNYPIMNDRSTSFTPVRKRVEFWNRLSIDTNSICFYDDNPESKSSEKVETSTPYASQEDTTRRISNEEPTVSMNFEDHETTLLNNNMKFNYPLSILEGKCEKRKKLSKRKTISPISVPQNVRVTITSPLAVSHKNNLSFEKNSQTPRNIKRKPSFSSTQLKKVKTSSPDNNQMLFEAMMKTDITPIKLTSAKKRRLTVKPFSFDERDQDFLRRRQQIKHFEDKETIFVFKAKDPLVLKKKPFYPEKKPPKHLNATAPNLSTEKRAKTWENIKKKRALEAQRIQALEEQARRARLEDMKEARKKLEFKATPIRQLEK